MLDVSVTYLGCFDKLLERNLSEHIKEARLCKGLTKTEFAQVLGVAMKSLWAWENDKYKPSQKNHEGIRKYINEFS
ncbi:MAG: helix-turn-helix transcriptional regulator [bacterium]